MYFHENQQLISEGKPELKSINFTKLLQTDDGLIRDQEAPILLIFRSPMLQK